jgi:hypothetical protein
VVTSVDPAETAAVSVTTLPDVTELAVLPPEEIVSVVVVVAADAQAWSPPMPRSVAKLSERDSLQNDSRNNSTFMNKLLLDAMKDRASESMLVRAVPNIG